MKGEDNTGNVKETKLYSLTEAGELLGISHRMMLYYVTRGKIKAIKLGCRWKIRGTDLKEIVFE